MVKESRIRNRERMGVDISNASRMNAYTGDTKASDSNSEETAISQSKRGTTRRRNARRPVGVGEEAQSNGDESQEAR